MEEGGPEGMNEGRGKVEWFKKAGKSSQSYSYSKQKR